MTFYDVLVTFDRVLTSALIRFLASTASVLPSALSESTSCVRTSYKEDTKRTSDVAFDEFSRVCRHGRIRTNTIFPDFWENLEHAQTVCTRLSFPPTPLIREPEYEASTYLKQFSAWVYLQQRLLNFFVHQRVLLGDISRTVFRNTGMVPSIGTTTTTLHNFILLSILRTVHAKLKFPFCICRTLVLSL